MQVFFEKNLSGTKTSNHIPAHSGDNMHWVSHETFPRKRRDHNVRRTFVLLLTAALLVFSLTACGRGQQNNGTTNGNGTVADNNGGVLDNGTNGTTNGQNNTNGGVMNDLENAGNDLVHGAEDLVDDVLPGENNTNGNGTNGNAASRNATGTARTAR